MGVSNTAVLAYGIDLGEELPGFLLDAEGEQIDWYDFEEGKELEVELIAYCSYDYPMYILAAKGTEINAHRGSVKKLIPEKLIFDRSVNDEKIRAFCEEYGIEYKQPEWLLNTING